MRVAQEVDKDLTNMCVLRGSIQSTSSKSMMARCFTRMSPKGTNQRFILRINHLLSSSIYLPRNSSTPSLLGPPVPFHSQPALPRSNWYSIQSLPKSA